MGIVRIREREAAYSFMSTMTRMIATADRDLAGAGAGALVGVVVGAARDISFFHA